MPIYGRKLCSECSAGENREVYTLHEDFECVECKKRVENENFDSLLDFTLKKLERQKKREGYPYDKAS